MPNFLIIGAAKAGTTALYRYLKQHPQIYMSSLKETQFFVFLEEENLNFNANEPFLRKYQQIKDIESYRNLFKKASQEIAIGEVSPWYIYLPNIPSKIKHYILDVKLIAMLRDPVERAYSNFLHSVRDDLEPINVDFVQAMELESKRILKNWSPRFHYKQKGFYYVQMKRYFDLFEPEQIRVYIYEDFKKKQISVLQDIYKFLGVDDKFVPDNSTKYNDSRIPISRVYNKIMLRANPADSILGSIIPPSLRNKIKNKLININLSDQKPYLPVVVRRKFVEEYREDILKLQDLIQMDLSHWL
ncbi:MULTISPECIES: sulfotransferase family protein [unclassified Coleofasciculus]|uniref:sulfotransferase family protein n=1 Tax=unclassified Coleofasciculus TaxID=2692782 RepID=UPI001D13B30B|nr:MULTISPECIES: sulfotransferase [unclassified Coleofasciculus]